MGRDEAYQRFEYETIAGIVEKNYVPGSDAANLGNVSWAAYAMLKRFNPAPEPTGAEDDERHPQRRASLDEFALTNGIRFAHEALGALLSGQVLERIDPDGDVPVYAPTKR